MPTYKYRDTKNGAEYEVVQKITEDPYQTVGELLKKGFSENEAKRLAQAAPTPFSVDNPVVKVPNWDGAGYIEGAGVYKQGLISSSANARKEVTKANRTKITIEDILRREKEEESEK